MKFQLDHIVHVTDDPAKAVTDMQKLGMNAVLGGEHANWGTSNGLSYFGLTYIEFLGIKHMDIAKKVTDNTLIQQLVAENRNGLSRFALRVNDIDEAARHFQNLGLHVMGPVPGSRMQPDGNLLQWAMLFIEDDGPDRFRLPFIIDWKQSDTERRKQLTERGLITGKARLSDIWMAADNLEKAVNEWHTFFGANIMESFIDDELNAHCTRVTLGDQSLTFCERRGGGRPFRISIEHTGEKKLVHFYGGEYDFS